MTIDWRQLMPIYEYEPDSEKCDDCDGRFEVIQRFEDDALSQCPTCEKPCHRVPSNFMVTGSTGDILSSTNLEKKGFTQYKKTETGRYEKTFGSGPKIIKKE